MFRESKTPGSSYISQLGLSRGHLVITFSQNDQNLATSILVTPRLANFHNFTLTFTTTTTTQPLPKQ